MALATNYARSSFKSDIMILEAIQKYGEIYPVGGRESILDGFMSESNCEMFWFDDANKSTYLIIKEI